MKLWIETSDERLSIEWPVPGGAWRRGVALAAMAICLSFPLLMFKLPQVLQLLGFPCPASWTPDDLVWMTLAICALAFIWCACFYFFPMAQLSGHGTITLRGDRINLHGGGWSLPLRARRDAIASFEREGQTGIRLRFRPGWRRFLRLYFLTGMGVPYFKRGLLVKLPGAPEADEVLTALRRWLIPSDPKPAPYPPESAPTR